MPPKKNAKSNKTAHVLNLLSHTAEADLPTETGSVPTDAKEDNILATGEITAPSTAAPLMPPMLEIAHSLDNSLSDAIRGALEDDLEGYMKTQNVDSSPLDNEDITAPEKAEAAAELSSLQEADSNAPELSSEQPTVPAVSQSETTPEPVTVAAPEAAVPVSPLAPQQPSVNAMPDSSSCHTSPDKDDDIIYVNVMQELVEEKADKYIKLFGLCTCRRCRVDVKALALSHLPPKYVVMHKGEMIPMLTFYEGQYSVGVTAQLAHACQQVLEHPRHKL